MKPLAGCKLYTFVDTAFLYGRPPADVAKALCDGGSDLIQLRAKNSPPDEIRKMADGILPILQAAGVGLVINDHPAIAHLIGADVCHLGQEDFFDAGHQHCAEIRAGREHLKIGLSTHGPAQAERALATGPDYIAIGPVYATGTKPNAKPVTLEYVGWAAQNVTLPWFAIGGINLRTIDAVLEAGAKRVCVVSAILNATDIAKACEEFKRKLG